MDRHFHLGTMESLQAAVVFAGFDAAISHTSALFVWGLLKGPPNGPVHVAVPRTGVRSHQGVRVHQRTAGPVHTHLGIRVVSVREALVGAAACMDLDELRFPAMKAVSDGLVSQQELADTAGVPRRSLHAMRMIAEEAAAGAESGGEAKYWRLLKDSHLPTPALQVWIKTHRGRKRVDAYWKMHNLAAEIDSREFHAKEAAFEADLARQNALHATSALLIRFSVAQVMNEPGSVLEDTELNLLARGWPP
jgi:very-short-patch-repair endonuclease